MDLIGAPTSLPGADINNLQVTLQVLDFGYVRYIEHWGADYRIIEAARMSVSKGFQGWDTDAKLLDYLYANHHATPFEMAGLILEVQAPIFIFREWHRHRTQSYSEMSARYVPMPDENYVPERGILIERSREAAESTNRQAQGTKAITESDADEWLLGLKTLYGHAQIVYQAGLNMGVPKELARLPVPVARYSRMRVQANLRNWLAFMTLRSAPNAQWEIRMYAHCVGLFLKACFPRTWELYLAHGRGV